MALTATIYNFDVELADTDRHVYESLALRLARHPSESEEYLVARLIAYLLEFAEGIEFSPRGLSSADEPAIAIRDLTGALTAWIDRYRLVHEQQFRRLDDVLKKEAKEGTS